MLCGLHIVWICTFLWGFIKLSFAEERDRVGPGIPVGPNLQSSFCWRTRKAAIPLGMCPGQGSASPGGGGISTCSANGIYLECHSVIEQWHTCPLGVPHFLHCPSSKYLPSACNDPVCNIALPIIQTPFQRPLSFFHFLILRRHSHI